MNSPAQPAAARIYDYLLGGTDNDAVDRAAAEKVLAVAPDQRRLARANRALGRWRQEDAPSTRLRIAGGVGRKP